MTYSTQLILSSAELPWETPLAVWESPLQPVLDRAAQPDGDSHRLHVHRPSSGR